MVEIGWSPSPQIAFSPEKEKVQHHRIYLMLKTKCFLLLCTVVFPFWGEGEGGCRSLKNILV